MKSRVVKQLSFRDYLQIYGHLTALFFEKSFKNAKEISLAMKSRGFFND
ncbi:CbiQ family ECF transporter T component [Sulfurihydrogenibium sp.]|nr:CbiQ family ECF transporter T component [Sulfurihydrogenibium sp.]